MLEVLILGDKITCLCVGPNVHVSIEGFKSGVNFTYRCVREGNERGVVFVILIIPEVFVTGAALSGRSNIPRPQRKTLAIFQQGK